MGKELQKAKAEAFYNYINKFSKYDKKDYAPSLKTKLNKFVSNLHQEVKDFNAGRKKTIKQMPIKIAEPKKSVIKLNPVKSKKLTKKKSEVKQRGNTDKSRDILFQAKNQAKEKQHGERHIMKVVQIDLIKEFYLDYIILAK